MPSSAPQTHPLCAADIAIALALAALFVAALMLTMDIGFVRDEGFYFHAATDYLGWFKALLVHATQGDFSTSFTQAEIDTYWSTNAEHPALPKALFGLSAWLFHETLGWMDRSTAMRFPSVLSAGALVAMVYLFTKEAFGRAEGILAAVLTAAMPRPFFHAHLAAFDYAVVTTWFFLMVAWWKSLRSHRWALVSGLAFGLALSVKHNAFFGPIVLVIHWLLIAGHRITLSGSGSQRRIQIPPLPSGLVAMALLGPLVWYALWPRHWFDTFARIKWYLEFHLQHVHYFQYFFGQNLYEPPFPVTFPAAMSLFTMPAITLLAFVGGTLLLLWRAAHRPPKTRGMARLCKMLGIEATFSEDSRGTGWWLALNVLVPFAIISHPQTPIFGGIKHWMAAMPFMAIIAAVGVVAAGRALGRRFSLNPAQRTLAVTALCALVALPAITATGHGYRHGTSFYNTLIGGTRGAADAHMMRQFWGYSSVNALDFLNRRTDIRGQVFFQNTCVEAYHAYQEDGDLREDIRYGIMSTAQFGMIHHQMAARSLEIAMWEAYGTRNPSFVASYDGVPILLLYENQRRLPRTPRKPGATPPAAKPH